MFILKDKIVVFLGYLLAILMTLLVFFTLLQVGTRYILNNQTTFTEELLRILLIWTSLLGAAYCFGTKAHLSLGLIYTKLSSKNSIYLKIANNIIVIIGLSSMMIYGGSLLIANNSHQITPILGLKMSNIYSVVLVSGLLSIFFESVNILEEIRKVKDLK